MAKRTPVLTASKIRKSFGPVTIVDNFSLEVFPGEAIALTGRNGAGKSTILRMLIGADRPDDGRVEFRTDESGGVTVVVDGHPQSYVDPHDPGLLTFEYVQHLATCSA